MVWCKVVQPGTYYSLCQDPVDGAILAIGESAFNRSRDYAHVSVPIHYDPTGNTNDVNIAEEACGAHGPWKFKNLVSKFDIAGEHIWSNVYGADLPYAEMWGVESRGFTILPLTVDGSNGYLVTGYTKLPGNNDQIGQLLRLRSNGTVRDQRLFTPAGSEPALDIQPGDGLWLRATDVTIENGQQKVLITGAHFREAVSVPLWVMSPDAGNFAISVLQDTRTPELSTDGSGQHDPTKLQYSTNAKFVREGGELHVLWPIMSNYENGGLSAGKKHAQLWVYKVDIQGGLLWPTHTDLGEVRAYDLQSDLCVLANGDEFVTISSRWADGHTASNPFTYADLTQDQLHCLTTTFGGDQDLGPGYDPQSWVTPEATDGWEYWNTNAYVCKVNIADGVVRWSTDFDVQPMLDPACFPADLKKQECMYRISELPDGGLLVSGNSSHNGDDSYLAKLYPDCQSRQAYDFVVEEALDANHQYTVAINEVWNTNKSIHGIIAIPAGHSLTIEGATIQFADTRQLDHATRVVVEPGGRLIVRNNAVLTSIGTCPNSMWDGIVVKGTNESQDGNNYADQGYAYVREATIENARTALITNNQFLDGDDLAAYQLQFAGGGVIRTRGATFRNNKRDVVMGPYENHAPGDPSEIRVNRSYFHDCDFIVDAPLNDHARPLEHMALYGVRNIPILGCDFAGTPYQPDQNSPMSMDAGLGVRGVNASFIIAPFCPVIVPIGEPCPTPIPSTFDRLTLGVEVAGITDDKTFSIDQAVFTRCPRSIRMDAVRDAAITNNRIDVADWTHPFAVGTPYGVYSDECTGYEIEDNAFTASTATDHARAGLVIKNSGRESNRVYNNSFDDFGYKNSTALLIQGRNANPDDNYLTGLDIKCNDFGQSGNKNAYDVALTAGEPTVRGTQGASSFSDDYTAPAGNRFSLLDADESDWHVANTSNFVVYYHHQGSTEAWVPQDVDAVYLNPEPSFVNPPANWNEACPSNQRSRERERSGLVAGSEEKSEELEESMATYDATLDNGDTYSLLGYVSDPTKSSTQVRNALQTVAPNVGVEVWQAAFERSPALNAWNLTQALLSNSPLQPEAMKLCYESDLSDFYYNLVASAQNGINPLDILESDISTNASGKAEDLTDLGRWSWLDSTNVDSVILLLKNWHNQLPADNGDAVLAGYYSANRDYLALYDLAAALELASSTPGVYGVLKHYANAEQADGWTRPDAATSNYLSGLAQDRWMIGSARAGAWLNALGEEPLEEVVILPLEERTMEAPKRVRNSSSLEAIILEAYPNPTDGLAYVVCNVPEGVEQATVRVHDLTGRLVAEQRLTTGSAIVELDLSDEPGGVYAAALELDGVRTGTVKLTVH